MALAFSLRNLSVLAYANSFTLWHYKSCDSQSTIAETGFFDDAGDMLAAGDMLMVSARDGGRMVCVMPEKSGIRTVPLC